MQNNQWYIFGCTKTDWRNEKKKILFPIVKQDPGSEQKCRHDVETKTLYHGTDGGLQV